MNTQLNRVQMAQEEEYSFPYHYIPMSDSKGFSQVLYWPWGYRYLGGLRIVFDQLKRVSFDSLIDIGCGDGRFLQEVSKRYRGVRMVGVDYSERCIQMARAMNPGIPFLCQDITKEEVKETFEVATAIEVLEHIYPEQLGRFVRAVANLLKGNGQLVLTVPHKNKPLSKKHFQHFTGQEIIEILSPYFENFEVVPFDPHSSALKRIQKLIGGFGNHFLVTNRTVLSFFLKLYMNRYLYAANESRCRRIAVKCKKR